MQVRSIRQEIGVGHFVRFVLGEMNRPTQPNVGVMTRRLLAEYCEALRELPGKQLWETEAKLDLVSLTAALNRDAEPLVLYLAGKKIVLPPAEVKIFFSELAGQLRGLSAGEAGQLVGEIYARNHLKEDSELIVFAGMMRSFLCQKGLLQDVFQDKFDYFVGAGRGLGYARPAAVASYLDSVERAIPLTGEEQIDACEAGVVSRVGKCLPWEYLAAYVMETAAELDKVPANGFVARLAVLLRWEPATVRAFCTMLADGRRLLGDERRAFLEDVLGRYRDLVVPSVSDADLRRVDWTRYPV